MYVSQSGRSTLTPSSSDLIRGSRHYKFNPSCLQTGRSMVEMLGVLAIIGVLTVGAMAGYKTAMKRLRANNILELITQASLEAQRANKKIDLEDLDDVSESTLQCIQNVEAYSLGQVVVTFKNDPSCADEPIMMAASIGKCKWYKESNFKWRYIPNRGSQNGVCDDYDRQS